MAAIWGRERVWTCCRPLMWCPRRAEGREMRRWVSSRVRVWQRRLHLSVPVQCRRKCTLILAIKEQIVKGGTPAQTAAQCGQKARVRKRQEQTGVKMLSGGSGLDYGLGRRKPQAAWNFTCKSDSCQTFLLRKRVWGSYMCQFQKIFQQCRLCSDQCYFSISELQGLCRS